METLKTRGQAILLIDCKLSPLTPIAERHYIMEKGRVVWSGDSIALAECDDLKRRYLGV